MSWEFVGEALGELEKEHDAVLRRVQEEVDRMDTLFIELGAMVSREVTVDARQESQAWTAYKQGLIQAGVQYRSQLIGLTMNAALTRALEKAHSDLLVPTGIEQVPPNRAQRRHNGNIARIGG